MSTERAKTMVEHVHHWRLELPDDAGVQVGRCWCGQEKSFAPFEGRHDFVRRWREARNEQGEDESEEDGTEGATTPKRGGG